MPKLLEDCCQLLFNVCRSFLLSVLWQKLFFFEGRELFSPDLKDLATIHVNDGVNSMAFFLVEFDGIISKLFLCAYCL